MKEVVSSFVLSGHKWWKKSTISDRYPRTAGVHDRNLPWKSARRRADNCWGGYMFGSIARLDDGVTSSSEAIQTNVHVLTPRMEKALHDISKKTNDISFYVVDLQSVVEKFLEFRRLLPSVRPFYAVKCNPNPSVLQVLASLGCGFDCASKAELKMLKDLSIHPQDDVIFANPCKAPDHLSFADKYGVKLTTFDNAEELHKIARLTPNLKCLIRIATDDVETSSIPLSAKYGAQLSEIPALIRLADQLQIRVVGVTFHVGSDCRAVEGYIAAIRLAKFVFQIAAEERARNCDCLRRKIAPFHVLDIGGGFPSSEGNTTLHAIAQGVNRELAGFLSNGVEVIAEPGRFLVADSHTLAAQIISKRVRGNRTDYYIGDGVYGSFADASHVRRRYSAHLLLPESVIKSRPLHRGSLFGPTCDAVDTIDNDILLPDAHIGEWIFFPTMGAYTRCLGSTFNGFDVPKTCHTLWPAMP